MSFNAHSEDYMAISHNDFNTILENFDDEMILDTVENAYFSSRSDPTGRINSMNIIHNIEQQFQSYMAQDLGFEHTNTLRETRRELYNKIINKILELAGQDMLDEDGYDGDTLHVIAVFLYDFFIDRTFHLVSEFFYNYIIANKESVWAICDMLDVDMSNNQYSKKLFKEDGKLGSIYAHLEKVMENILYYDIDNSIIIKFMAPGNYVFTANMEQYLGENIYDTFIKPYTQDNCARVITSIKTKIKSLSTSDSISYLFDDDEEV